MQIKYLDARYWESLYGSKERKNRLHFKAEGKNASNLSERKDEKTERRKEIMIGKLTKYAPIAALLGYAAVYSSKGWQQIPIDLQAFAADPIGKMQAKWQNIAIAVVAGVAIGFIKKSGLPREIKVILTVIAYGIIGYELGLTLDPPYNGGGVVAASANRYANGGR